MQIQQGHGDNRTGEIESAGGASQVYISTRKMILKVSWCIFYAYLTSNWY